MHWIVMALGLLYLFGLVLMLQPDVLLWQALLLTAGFAVVMVWAVLVITRYLNKGPPRD